MLEVSSNWSQQQRGAPARRITYGLAALLAFSLSACGGSSSKAEPPATAPSAPAGQSASGTPLKIGLVNQEGGATGDFSQARLAMEATTKYINAELNGISGRPLEIVKCITDGTPEKSQSCANTMVGEKVVSVSFGQDLGASAAMPIYENANIPVIGGAPVSPAELSSKSAFFFSGAAPTQLTAMADFAVRNFKAKKVTGIFVDVAKPYWDAYIAAPAQGLGAQTGQITGANGAPDWTPQASQAIASKSDALIILGPPADCLNIAKALGALQNKIPTVFPGSCVGNDYFSKLGTAALGTYYNQEQTPLDQTDDPDVQTFRRVMEGYSSIKPADYNAYTELGFQTMMILHDQYNKIGADALTPAKVIETFRATSQGRSFLSTPYDCSGSVLPSDPALCHGDSPMYKWNGKKLELQPGNWNGLKYVKG